MSKFDFQPKKNIEAQMAIEQQLFNEIVATRHWEKMTEVNFPLLIDTQARPFYFAKLKLINEEVSVLEDAASVAGKEGANIAKGRFEALRKAGSETIAALYPDVTPIEKDISPVTPIEIETIELFVKTGSIEQLNENDSTGWNQLSNDQRLFYRLSALRNYYERWEDLDSHEFLDEGSSPGFSLGKPRETSRIKQISKIVKEKIITRHLSEWLTEALEQGVNEDDALVTTAKQMIEEMSESDL